MLLDKQKIYLEFEVVWKDEHIFELAISASNTSFFGKTEVYDQSESLSKFSKALNNFPKDSNHLFYELGEKDSYAYFSMNFYPVGKSGLIGVEINMESN